MIRASASYTSGWGSFVLLKMDHVRVAQGGSLSMLHQYMEAFAKIIRREKRTWPESIKSSSNL